jgi:hypothetical protein
MSGFYYINITCDTINGDIFPKLRRNGKISIFMDNIRRLSNAIKNSQNPPKLRFITMAFQSNFFEIPELVERCRLEFDSWEHQIRGIFSMKHIWTHPSCNRKILFSAIKKDCCHISDLFMRKNPLALMEFAFSLLNITTAYNGPCFSKVLRKMVLPFSPSI